MSTKIDAQAAYQEYIASVREQVMALHVRALPRFLGPSSGADDGGVYRGRPRKQQSLDRLGPLAQVFERALGIV